MQFLFMPGFWCKSQINQAIFSAAYSFSDFKKSQFKWRSEVGVSTKQSFWFNIWGFFYACKKCFSSSCVTNALKNQELGWTLYSETSVLWS